MLKRTFVLFFCLMQTLVFPLSARSTDASGSKAIDTYEFSPFAPETSSVSQQIVISDDILCRRETIIKADDFEWKENLSDLLRHRHSTYRFISLAENNAPAPYNFGTPSSAGEVIQTSAIAIRPVILPGYYGFLHRLCPF